MRANFFEDNPDLQRYLAQLDLEEVVEILERRYSLQESHADAPRNYADAMDNYRLMLNLLGDVCANEIAPRAAEASEEGVHLDRGRVTYAEATRQGLRLLRQAELMGAMLPRAYGGLNLPETVFAMMIEIVSRADAGLMTVFGLQEISATIAEHGDEELKERILPRFACGEVTGAMVLTEPDAGSDLGAVQTRACFDEATGQWLLSGVKRFITNGNADVLLVLARSEDGSQDARGLSLFVVEADETVRVRRLEHKMGLTSSPTCEIEFVNTPARLVGRRRFGLIRYAMAMMNGARLAVAAQALGIAEAAYREAELYARQRIQFGHPIGDIPAVYRMLLLMCGEIETTRALIYETALWVDLKKAYEQLKSEGALTPESRARLKQADRMAAVLTPLAKYHATEMGNRVCYQAMQVHGGAGYMREFDIERHYRDIRVTSIYEGTSQLQVVAATGGLLGHALDELLASWADDDYGPELADLKARAVRGSALLNDSIDRLKEQDREVIDYYGADLTDMAARVVTTWLGLRNAASGERKTWLARSYAAAVMPQVEGLAVALRELDAAPTAAKDIVLRR